MTTTASPGDENRDPMRIRGLERKIARRLFHSPQGPVRVMSESIEAIHMRPDGELETIKESTQTVWGCGHAVLVVDTLHNINVGGYCASCNEHVCRDCYFQCAECGQGICRRCLRMHEEMSYCPACDRRMRRFLLMRWMDEFGFFE